MILPILLLTVVVAIISAAATGGFIFSWQAAAPKFNKLNPLTGLKRMFGVQAAVELLKTVLKFAVVSGALAWVLIENIGI